MAARKIMIQGTMSNSGKSFLVAALCRIFRQDGYRTAPFKSQNMALNSYITDDGLEIGRAQAMQAEAAGIRPTVEMNPILLKPTSHMGSQVILKGEVAGNWKAMEYYRKKADFIPLIRESFARLEEQYEVIVLEGAGSPAEINLREHDIVNMGMAELADAPVLLVGDIDRGGVFASLYGTVMLLKPEERARIRGLVINKFRGDPKLLEPGLRMIEERLGIPVVGVIPMEEIDLDDEDSLSERLNRSGRSEEAISGKRGEEEKDCLDIVVIRLPHISNFTDFNILERRPGVCLRYEEKAEWLGQPDLLILPGTKNTMADLAWLRESGLETAIHRLTEGEGTSVIGICGGYQMLGEWLRDPAGAEGPAGVCMRGLGLLPAETVFSEEKTRAQMKGTLGENSRMFRGYSGGELTGYEIHMGGTTRREETAGDPDLQETWRRGGFSAEQKGEMTKGNPDLQETVAAKAQGSRMTIALADGRQDGMERADGRVFGSYLHGLFDNEELTEALLGRLAEEKGARKRLSGQLTEDRKEGRIEESSDKQGVEKGLGGQGVEEGEKDRDSGNSGSMARQARQNSGSIARQTRQKEEKRESLAEYRERQYDKLADLVRKSLDMERIYEILEESGKDGEREHREWVRPEEIERRSMEIIEQEMPAGDWTPGELAVVKRCIHTSADFDYASNLYFSPGAVEQAWKVLGEGARIVTDTHMAAAGINKRVLGHLGGEVRCFMAEEDVAQEAKRRGITRAVVSMERAAELNGPVIFAIGNAPTALLRLDEMIREGKLAPALVIAAPVGFVNVEESKKRIRTAGVPCIIAQGRKGGSNIAAAICNALLYQVESSHKFG